MKRVLLAALCALLSAAPVSAQTRWSDADLRAVHALDQEARLIPALEHLRAQAKTGALAFVGVSVLDPVQGTLIPNQTVIVRDERIAWVGPADSANLAGAEVIEGRGRILSPGLTDMHVHTGSLAQHALRLAAGVTSVRDLAGFPWYLRLREAIDAGRMIGATTYVSGTIIAARPLFGYAVVVRTPEAARQVVRNQAACGYSFIKIHNVLPLPLFDAVADEARRVGLDLVGHVPHDITLAHAIGDAGMRTSEHLKGFFSDRDFSASTEDFAQVLAGREVWITPTLYTRLDFAHGEMGERLSADPRMRYAPRASREAWLQASRNPSRRDIQLDPAFREAQRTAMSRLTPLHPRWLAGTDAAGYRFNIAGFALHDELRMMQEEGVPIVEVVRAATSAPADAMRRPQEFGRVAVGMRADLILLERSPLVDLSAYQSNLGVMARGRWYSREALDAALEAVARIYDEATPPSFTQGDIDRILAVLEAHAGYVVSDEIIAPAADALARARYTDAAARTRALSPPGIGVCLAETPN